MIRWGEVDDTLGRSGSHAVVRSDDEIDVPTSGQGTQPSIKTGQQRVQFLDGTTGLVGSRTINVPAIIGFFEVDHDKLRTQAVGQRQQPFGFVEALFKGQQGLLGIVLIIVGILS